MTNVGFFINLSTCFAADRDKRHSVAILYL